MPYVAKKGKGKTSSSKTKAKVLDDIDPIFETSNGDMIDIIDTADTERGGNRGKKRPFDFDDITEEEERDEATKESSEIEMQNLLASFGADIRKNMANKEKNVHKFTTGALKTTDKKVGEIWKKQRLDRSKLLEEFSNSINSVTHQCDADVVTINEKEKEWEKGFQEILNGVHQHRIIQTQRIKTLIQITNTLMKSFEDLENCHCEQQSNVQGELKKDMSQLQKKIMKETQQQELSNVRKSLQTMLAHV